MKYTLLLLALFHTTGYSAGFFELPYGKQPNHLTPIDYPPDDYDQRIAAHLFVTDGNLGRMVTRPSGGLEQCLSVYEVIPQAALKKHEQWASVPDNEKDYFITVARYRQFVPLHG